MTKFFSILSLSIVLTVVSCNRQSVTEPEIPTGTPLVSVVDGHLLVTNSVVVYGVTFRWNYLDQTVAVFNDTAYRVHIAYGGSGLANNDHEFYMEPRSERVLRHRIAREERVSILMISTTEHGEVSHSGFYKLGEQASSAEKLQVRCDGNGVVLVDKACSINR